MDVIIENKLVPKLRFGEFKDSWEEKKIGELFEIKAGGDISKDRLSSYKTNHFRYPVFSNSEKNKGLYGYTDLFRFEGNCITVTGRGKLGVANARIESFYPIVRLLVLNPKKDFDIYFGENSINRINFFIESTGIPQLTAPQISLYKIVFPSLIEQQKIASFLSAVDDKLQQLTKKKELLEEYKKGIMQQIFSQELRFKDDNGNNYPDWEEKRIGELFEFKQGVQCAIEGQFLKKKKGLVRFIRIVDLTKTDEPIRYIEDPGTTHHISNDDLFMVRYGNAGLVGYGYQGVIANNLFRIIPKEGTKIHNNFFHFLFRFKHRQFELLASSSTMPALNFTSLKTLKLISPSFKEQQKIANFLTSLDIKIELVSTQIENTKAFKKGLLQQMFV